MDEIKSYQIHEDEIHQWDVITICHLDENEFQQLYENEIQYLDEDKIHQLDQSGCVDGWVGEINNIDHLSPVETEIRTELGKN